MPPVQLPLGLQGSEDFPKGRQSLTNCFNTQQGQIIPRPGIAAIVTVAGVARGQFVWNDSLYQIFGTVLSKVTNVDTGARTTIGTIVGNAVTHTAVGFNTATIVVENGEIYTLDKSDVLVTISVNANFVPCRTLAHIDGRFIYIPFNGDPAFFSDVGAAGTVGTFSFFDAEELPDENRTVFNFNGTLYIGGTDSLELFRNTGASPNPFQRITGARISNGFIGALLEYGETFLFIGREKDQDFGIYAITQGRAQKISNQIVDLLLADSTLANREAAISVRFKWRGFDIAAFTIAGTTVAFNAGQWFFMSTINNVADAGVFGADFVTQFQGQYYVAFDSEVGRLEKINTDYGVKFIQIIDLGFQEPDNNKFGAQSLDVQVTQGFSSVAGSVGLFISRDNVLYTDGVFRNLGDLGEYFSKIEFNYPGGLGIFQGFMGVRLQTSSGITFGGVAEISFRNF